MQYIENSDIIFSIYNRYIVILLRVYYKIYRGTRLIACFQESNCRYSALRHFFPKKDC
ncbi:MAG: hypothetical protein OXN83_05700 [Oligoflexia bacterium]|nr:hypothetical protein [Oligoflexia bacterium]